MEELKEVVVLYVEDENDIRSVVLGFFNAVFNEVIVATNGEEGLEKYLQNKNKIDLVVTDINMPKMNGLDMLDAIKKEDPFIPMTITTAHNDLDFLHKAIDVGVTGYVTKPIDVRQLMEVIRKNAMPIIQKKKLEHKLKQEQEEKLKNAKLAAIGQMSAGITHEINTPLTFIKGTVEMMGYDIDDLEESNIKKNLKDDSKKIIDGITRIQNIINSMKELTSAKKPKKEKVNLYSTIMVALTIDYNKFKNTSNLFVNGEKFDIGNVVYDKYRFCVEVEKQQIEQVWIVIINNAMDELVKKDRYEDRRFEINIFEKNDKIIVRFKDNAGGIKDDILPHIFDPFKSTKESSGLGIGLNIAKNIVDKNGAKIKAYNEDNGAVFEVKFNKVNDC